MTKPAQADRRVTLVTGFPSTFLATRLLAKLLREEPNERFCCVVPSKFEARARAWVGELDARDRGRIELLEGDTASMDLGLSGREWVELAARVRVIHHCAAITFLGVERQTAERVNVGGTREVLELAENAVEFERLVHWSTALVSGARRGYVLEDELEAPAGFRNPIEETRFRAERIVRDASKHVPTTVLRPTIEVGDSRTGEIDRLEGPYLLVLLLLNAPVDLRVPLPGRGLVPLNLVPIDYVVDAGYAIVSDPRSLGRTFHLVDPKPLTARRVFELIAHAAGRPVPRGFLPANIATALLRAPGFERYSQMPLAFLEQLATEVVYDARGTSELLAGRNLECPGFEQYVDVLVQHVRTQQNARRARAREERAGREEEDPLL